MTATATQPANGVLTLSREERIHQAVDKGVTGNLAVNLGAGGASFKDMAEVCEFAKLMSLSRQAVPPHCRDVPGVCLALTIQAIEWRMSPFAVANKSYVVNDRVAYESQLIHAVIEQRAPITARLRHSFSGEGGKRRCKVWATPKGESEPLEYESPEFDKITPKNSPLWKSKPDLQLFYNTSRDWARMHFPDVIMGVYSDEEMAGIVNVDARDPAPKTLGDLTNQLRESRQLASSTPVKTTSYIGPEDNPCDDEPQEQEPGESVEKCNDYATTMAHQLDKAVADGDVATMIRIDNELFGEDSAWTPASDQERDFLAQKISWAKAELSKPARTTKKSQKPLMETAPNAE